MKLVTQEVFEAEIDEFAFSIPTEKATKANDFSPEPIAVGDMSEEQLAAAAKVHKTSPELLKEIHWAFDWLKDAVRCDLKELVKQNEDLKNRIAALEKGLDNCKAIVIGLSTR